MKQGVLRDTPGMQFGFTFTGSSWQRILKVTVKQLVDSQIVREKWLFMTQVTVNTTTSLTTLLPLIHH